MILSTLTVLSAALYAAEPLQSHPNILIVFPDQMRGSAIGALGIEPVKTPNIDQFMKESVRFNDAVSNYPVCSPFRAMLISGMYPFKNGVMKNCSPATAPKCGLKKEIVCWTDVLSQSGYDLGFIGKWHLDAPHKPHIEGTTPWNEWCPPERRHGFNFWYAYGAGGTHMKPQYWNTTGTRDSAFWVKEYSPRHEAKIASDYIANVDGKFRDPKKPFLLIMGVNPPHTPYKAVPQKYVDLYDNLDVEAVCRKFPQLPPKGTKHGDLFRNSIKHYYAQCSGVDEAFGKVLKTLKENNLDSNTIVLFTSDHGDLMGMYNHVGKSTPHDISMQIPFIVRWPGKLAPRTDSLLISTPDIGPSLLGLAGVKSKISPVFDGLDLSAAICSDSAIRPEGQLYIYEHEKTKRRGFRDHEWTYVLTRQEKKPESVILYNRIKDPAQLKNFASEYPDICSKLRDKMEMEQKRIHDNTFHLIPGKI